MSLADKPNGPGSILVFKLSFLFFLFKRKKVSGAIPAINAMYGNTQLKAALSIYLQHFLHICGLKQEGMLGSCGGAARCFRNSTD